MKTIWILILAKSGIIEEPEIFYDELSALRRKKVLMRDFNPDYDVLDIFEKDILLSKLREAA